jgi:hypothetical protein
MSNTSKYNFPNVQKVQIFEQVDTYIENNNPTPPSLTVNIDNLGNLNTGDASIQGNQIGIQQTEDPQ